MMDPSVRVQQPVFGTVTPIQNSSATALCLAFLLCAGLTGSALGQETARPQAAAAADYEEISKLLDSLQTRVEAMNDTAKDTDAAMDFLSEQVDEAIVKLSNREAENATLRDTAMGLSAELEALAGTRDDLGSQLARLTRERDEVVERLESQVRELASLLSLEQKTTKKLRGTLDARSAELRATLDERDRTALELGEARRALAAQRQESEIRGRELAALKLEVTRLQSDRAALDSRLAEEIAGAETTKASLDEARARNHALRGELDASESRIEELNQRLVALRGQIAELSGLLGEYESRDREQEQVIADLGRRLNLALARKVRELARYRSEFFGRLREVLGDRPDIRIVGDRFVFQSEVLFRTGEAELEPDGRAQLLRLAESLKEIAAAIPSDIDWVLRIDGHTDERPIQTERFPSNWELSTARAISVIKFLIEQGVPSDRVMAAGFAHFRPLDRAHNEAAFRRNRRIEFRLTQK